MSGVKISVFQNDQETTVHYTCPTTSLRTFSFAQKTYLTDKSVRVSHGGSSTFEQDVAKIQALETELRKPFKPYSYWGEQWLANHSENDPNADLYATPFLTRLNHYAQTGECDERDLHVKQFVFSEASRQRAKRQLTLFLENGLQRFNYFATLTFAPEHLPADYKSLAKTLLPLERKFNRFSNGTLRYAAVPERGGERHRYHWHLLISSQTAITADALAGMWGNGFVHLHRIKKTDVHNRKRRIVNYLGKYMSKDDFRKEGARRMYYASHNWNRQYITLNAPWEFFRNLPNILSETIDKNRITDSGVRKVDTKFATFYAQDYTIKGRVKDLIVNACRNRHIGILCRQFGSPTSHEEEMLKLQKVLIGVHKIAQTDITPQDAANALAARFKISLPADDAMKLARALIDYQLTFGCIFDALDLLTDGTPEALFNGTLCPDELINTSGVWLPGERQKTPKYKMLAEQASWDI